MSDGRPKDNPKQYRPVDYLEHEEPVEYATGSQPSRSGGGGGPRPSPTRPVAYATGPRDRAKTSVPARADHTQAETVQVLIGEAEKEIAAQVKLLTLAGIDKEYFKAATLNAMTTTKGIGTCSPESVMQAIRHCCMDGLVPDGTSAVIVPFRGEAKYVPMREGLCRMITRMIPGAQVLSGVIMKSEWEDPGTEILEVSNGQHVIKIKRHLDSVEHDFDSVVGAWCSIMIPGHAVPYTKIADKARLLAARNASPAGSKGFGPWVTHPKPMAEKTAIRVCAMSIRHLFAQDAAQAITRVASRDVESGPGTPMATLPERPSEPAAASPSAQDPLTDKWGVQ